MGFYFKKLDGQKLLLEKAHVIVAHTIILHRIVGKDIHSVLWLDKTCVNAGESVEKCWTDDTPNSSGHQPTGRGSRLIVAHAGSSNGFVPEGLLVFPSRKTGDYHEDMDHPRFLQWFKHLLLQFSIPTVFVMNNSPCHSMILDKTPTTSDHKGTMVQWLQARDIAVDMSMTKLLYSLVKQNKPVTPKYTCKIASKQGHLITGLLPSHCHFNPIELVWSEVKAYIRSNNKTFTIIEVERLLREGLVIVDPNSWEKKVDHVAELIREAHTIDSIINENEQLMISLGDDDEVEDNGFGADSDDSEGELDGTAPLTS
ncbi:uncharacterized protein LOC126194907 isoform X1 [Schistocerca nitens]|uniref:uncharacterized protein LOC126194907 isoform X1 n=1 Tax=Schistocerca nitens TaxID=7011 RepID=UPI00211739CD|nr:uncharacterized protein LOC126194907 isoform X1 [Schistocerca nitens]